MLMPLPVSKILKTACSRPESRIRGSLSVPDQVAKCAASLQGYILLLLRSDASLLGLKYLTILIYTFLNPPIRHRYEETDYTGRTVDAPHSAAARIYAGRFISTGS